MEFNFETDITYQDRESKAAFVYQKYSQILSGRILDVGADQGFLKNHLPPGVFYQGIGFSDRDFITNLDLEQEKIPFPDNSFDCVLCLDVLEHLENIHEIFDELCRISKEWIIVSLPNPWADLMTSWTIEPYKVDRNTKYYGLPLEREKDRHKWFFSSSEALQFIKYRSEKNEFELIDLDVVNQESDGTRPGRTILHEIHWYFFRLARRWIFRKDFNFQDLYESTQWYVLRNTASQVEK